MRKPRNQRAFIDVLLDAVWDEKAVWDSLDRMSVEARPQLDAMIAGIGAEYRDACPLKSSPTDSRGGNRHG